MKFTDEFFAAVKRRDSRDMMRQMFEQCGEDEAAEIANATSRVTDKMINGIKVALGDNYVSKLDEIEEEVEEVEEELEEVEEELEEIEAELEEAEQTEGKFPDIKKLIKKGKFKKALKQIKKIEGDNGGSVLLKQLKEEAKAGKDNK